MTHSRIDNIISNSAIYLRKYLAALSSKGIYIVLLLTYAYKSPVVPSWAKRIIIGSLAYFLSPIDSIPDLTPFIGMTDDLSLLAFSLVTISCYINQDVREKAQRKLTIILKDKVDLNVVREVDAWL